jgi:hypothetical protein
MDVHFLFFWRGIMNKRYLLALAGALLVTGFSTGAKAASYAWSEDNDLASTLGGTAGYSVSGNVATVSYTNQTFTNNGSAQSDVGMYFGWNWIGKLAVTNDADYSGYESLNWNDGLQAFYEANFAGTGSSVAMTITASVPESDLPLSTVGNSTLTGPGWTGTPYSFDGAPAITTNSSMSVPFFDFGAMSAGEVKTYDINFVFTFSDSAGLDQFGDFYVSAQGVSAVPVPASVWGGAGLLGLLAAWKGLSKKSMA